MKNWLISVAFALSLSSTPVLAKESAKKPKVVHLCKKNDTAVNILACNVYMESRGESLKGKMAVAFVTMNRVQRNKFPSSVRKVVFQKSQFSWVGVHSKVTDVKSWKEAKDIAGFVYILKKSPVLYDFVDPTNGSVYYHRENVKPGWRHMMTKQTVIGRHIFYSEGEA
uniref:Endolysin n=1 Tax=Salmonella phage vB_SEnST11_KE23 TaxID=3161174 RepID=A0AAU8GFL9_9CAUD